MDLWCRGLMVRCFHGCRALLFYDYGFTDPRFYDSLVPWFYGSELTIGGALDPHTAAIHSCMLELLQLSENIWTSSS